MRCECCLDLKTTGVSIILFWIMVWGFWDEVKIARFLVSELIQQRKSFV